ncbi:hypothetical protein [Nitrospira sp. Kam-Ns4a]
MLRTAATAKWTLWTLSLLWLGCPLPSSALEKYGRPLPAFEEEREEGAPVGPEEEETAIGGYFLTSAFVTNPTFAARPNNTGLVGLRHMAHFETDLYKQYLTFYTDQNFFSDRTRGWIKLTEWDMTYGFTGIFDHWGWRIQYERDAPLDQSGLKQIYADAVVTYRVQAAQDWGAWRRLLPNQNISVYLGPGWLFYNSNYFARPDNTGRALFRYVAHADVDLYKQRGIAFADINMFTDRTASNVLRPTELDWILGIAFRWRDLELSIYREQDLPLDKPGLVQQYTAVQLRFAFDLSKGEAKRFLKRVWASP